MSLDEKEIQSIIQEVNQNFSDIPIKYDDFLEFYESKSIEDETNSDQEAAKQSKLKAAVCYALSEKNPESISTDEVFASQTISEECITEMTKKVEQMSTWNDTIEETVIALQNILKRTQTSQRKEEKLVKKIKCDFLHQQSRLTAVMREVFGLNYDSSSPFLSKLFDTHFEDVNKFVDIPEGCDQVIQLLASANLIEINPNDREQLRLKQI